MSKIQSNCPFYEGIDACNVTGCNYNILGGCFKKGSANYDKARDSIKPKTYFEKIKAMDIDDMTDFFSHIDDCQFCAFRDTDCCWSPNEERNPEHTCYEGFKEWLESEVEE